MPWKTFLEHRNGQCLPFSFASASILSSSSILVSGRLSSADSFQNVKKAICSQKTEKKSDGIVKKFDKTNRKGKNQNL